MVCRSIGQAPPFVFSKAWLPFKSLKAQVTCFFGAWEAICSPDRHLWQMLAPGRKGSVSNQGNSSLWWIPSLIPLVDPLSDTDNFDSPKSILIQSNGEYLNLLPSCLQKKYMLGKTRKKREWMQPRVDIGWRVLKSWSQYSERQLRSLSYTDPAWSIGWSNFGWPQMQPESIHFSNLICTTMPYDPAHTKSPIL